MTDVTPPPEWMVDLRDHAGRCCSGFFFDADHLGGLAPGSVDQAGGSRYVLTAAHFLKDLRGEEKEVALAYASTTQRSSTWRLIPHTDLAVVQLPRTARPDFLPRLGRARLFPGARFVAHGFGTTSKLVTRRGVYLFPILWVATRGLRTRVLHGGYVFAWPRAIPGDSGGPVLIGEEVVATQSMIFDPLGFNAGVAVIARIRPHLRAIREVVAQLEAARASSGSEGTGP